MRHGKKDSQQLAVRDPRWVEDNLDGFRVSRSLSDHLIVGGSLGSAAGISRCGVEDAFDPLKNSLRAPKATTGKNRGLFARRRRRLGVHLGGRDWQVGGRVHRKAQ